MNSVYSVCCLTFLLLYISAFRSFHLLMHSLSFSSLSMFFGTKIDIFEHTKTMTQLNLYIPNTYFYKSEEQFFFKFKQ